jgi:menaquinone-dependent protoporphyrinogen oxidase
VVYGTTDGHTAKVARSLADGLRREGAEVDIVDARDDDRGPTGYDGVIVAASLHAGGYQRSVGRWVRTHVWVLDGKQTAFVSVCLGVLQHDPAVDRDIEATIEKFLTSAGWQPKVRKIVAGALLYTRYNWIKSWVMRRIVKKAGGDTDTSRDYVYTDWKDLQVFATRFLDLVHDRVSGASPHTMGEVDVLV